MSVLFGSEFFKQNRLKLAELFGGKAPIVLTANGLVQRSADTSYKFRQDSNFWYLTGINEPDVILVIDKEKEYLIVPDREQTREVFDGALDLEKLAKISGIEKVYNDKDGWKLLGARLKKVKFVAGLEPAPLFVESYGFYTNPSKRSLIKNIRAINPEIKLIDLRKELATLRVIKQASEINAIQEAVSITQKAIKKVKNNLPSYNHEFEIEADLTSSFKKQGADHAYHPIVAVGHNATTLHYTKNNAAYIPQELVLIDTGAEVENYAADITRTFSAQEPSKRQKAVYQAVIDAQEYAFSLLKPGVLLNEYEIRMEHFLGEKLRELLLIKVINKENVRKFCPHSVSHFLGLDVHDVGNYKKPLQAGIVLTVEPGIYIPEENLGVRIEDDIVITESGNKNLSAKIPKNIF